MNNITIHIVNSIPWSNLNRDDTGTPKHMTQGGVIRGLLSSQSIKRAVRTDFENKLLGIGSVRSSHLVDYFVKRALAMNSTLDEAATKKTAKSILKKLTENKKNSKKSDKKSNDTQTGSDSSEKDKKDSTFWLSEEEINAAINILARGVDEGADEVILPHRTGSLAIASFGRMFASKPECNTDAAISVSPAVSTHAAVIETDYFSTVDDAPSEEQGAGASYLGIASYTNGVFYRTITIDKNQLHTAWTGFEGEQVRKQLEALVSSIIYKLPRGKVTNSAPFTMPLVVLAEEQNYRMAYDFEQPVSADKNGGYSKPTVEKLLSEFEVARQFDPQNFGRGMVAGTSELVSQFSELDAAKTTAGNKQQLTDFVVDWILQ